VKTRLFSVLGVAGLALFVLAFAPSAQAACCGGCNTLVSGSCCNVFGCNCDGPCSNFGCGCPPVASSDYCGVCPGYSTSIVNGQCVYSSSSAAAGTAAKPSAVQAKGPTLMLAPATPAQRFKAIDKNNDGVISYEEAAAWVKKNGGGSISDADLRARFKTVDKNNDGKVQPGEFDAELAKK